MPEGAVHIRIAGLTDVGLVREHNEDSFLVVDLDRGTTDLGELEDYEPGPRGTLLLVCDGMGGAAAGEVASSMAVEGMRHRLLDTPEPEAAPASTPVTPAEPAAEAPVAAPSGGGDGLENEPEVLRLAHALREAVFGVNLEIFEAACADVSKAGMGTTLTGLWLRGPRVIVAQVGDSRAYLWRRGKLTQITHDQSLVNSLLDSGQITAEQAKLFEHSNVILQALGVQEDVEVLLSTEELCRGDRLLLCSDGLVGVVSDDEIQEVLGLSDRLEDIAQTLVDMARAAGGPDNISVLVAEARGDALPAPEEHREAAYRPLALEPPPRRVRFGDGADDLGPDPPYVLGARDLAPPLSMAAVLSMAWVIGLLVAGLVVAILLYPRTRPPAARAPARGALCYFVADAAGLDILIDGRSAGRTSGPGTEVLLAPGRYTVRVRDSQHQPPIYSQGQELRVAPGQRCALKLRPLSAAEGRVAPIAVPIPPPVPDLSQPLPDLAAPEEDLRREDLRRPARSQVRRKKAAAPKVEPEQEAVPAEEGAPKDDGPPKTLDTGP